VLYWGQNSISIKNRDNPAKWEQPLETYCTDSYDIINLGFLHIFKDSSAGKGPNGEPLPNVNFAYHCDTSFAQQGDPQFPYSGMLKVRR
jgi:hypothetical protein